MPLKEIIQIKERTTNIGLLTYLITHIHNVRFVKLLINFFFKNEKGRHKIKNILN